MNELVRCGATTARSLAAGRSVLSTGSEARANGREDPGDAARQEGYLFWLAWAQHMATQLFSSSDAHGSYRPVFLAAPCQTLAGIIARDPTGIFSNLNLFGDPSDGGQGAIIGSSICTGK